MKTLKLLILVSVFGFFTACGGAKTEETQTETPAVEAPATEEAPAVEEAPAAGDSTQTEAPAETPAQ
ncbi:hypothetical protein [Rhodoflexus sp.]